MTFDPKIPYNELPELPPVAELETGGVLKLAIASSRALSTLVSDCKRLPNSGIFYNRLFLSEAKDSSEIENIVTTNDELFRAAVSEQATENSNAKEVLHYVDALWDGTKMMRETGLLTKQSFIRIADMVNGNTAGVRATPGTTLKNRQTGEVVYTPPEGKNVILGKLDNLERFINEDSVIDPLIRMAVIHYQFEAIHPFSDGNGRTGRIINLLFLEKCGLIEHPVLFLSRYIINNRDGYYEGLRGVTERGDWVTWIMYILRGVEETSRFMSKKIEDIIVARLEMKEAIRQGASSIYSKDLIDVLFSQPYCKIKHLMDAGIAKRATASVYLHRLEKLGILTSFKSGREKVFVNKRLFEILKR